MGRLEPLFITSLLRRSALALGLLLTGAGITAAAAGLTPAAAPRLVKPVVPPVQLPDGNRLDLAQASQFIRVGEARSQYSVTGKGLTVAVLDTGIRASHRDFAGKTVTQRNYTSDNRGSATDASDGDGHGTNVTGIIAANGVHTGMAPGANVLAMKVLDNDGGGDFETIGRALDYVISNRAALNITVVNLSLGDGGNYTASEADNVQSQIRSLRNAGVAVVVAAGNDFKTHRSRQGMGYPAIYAETVSVGAVYDADIGQIAYGDGAEASSTGPGRITPFSQRLHSSLSPLSRTDIFAPGAPITSSGTSSDTSSSTQHGTSQATPVTAGVLLLMQEYHLRVKGTLPSVDQLETWLRKGAAVIKDGDDEDDNVTNTGLEFHRLDALGAMEAMAANFTDSFSVSGTVTENGAGASGVTVSAGGKSATTAANGTYTIVGLAAGTYSVVPARAGVTLAPVSRSVTVGPNQTGVDFTATTPSERFTVSGAVTENGAGLGGVTISAGGATTTTAPNGSYTLFGLPVGNHTVTPSRVGYAFSPASQAVNVTGNQTGINFTAGARASSSGLSIRGVVTEGGVGVAGVVVNAGGHSAVSGADGAYALTGLTAGSYTVTPVRSGYTFTPGARAVNLAADQSGVDFAGVKSGLSIRGQVTENGVGLAGVTVSVAGQSAATASDGSYALSGLAAGTYIVTPTRAGRTFNPASRTVALNSDQNAVDFTTGASTFTIRGTITDGAAGLGGVTVSVGGRSVATTSDGAYSVTGLAPGSYTVAPSRSGRTFTPASRSITVGPDQNGVNFTTLSQVFSISGVVREDGAGVRGVTVSAGGRSVQTGRGGVYTLSGLAAGVYTVAPAESAGVTYSPPARTITLGPDARNVDFDGSSGPRLVSVKLTATQLKGTTFTTGSVHFDKPVTSATVVTLATSNPEATTISTTAVKVAKGKSSARFTIRARGVRTMTEVTISASFSGATAEALLTVVPRSSASSRAR